MSDFSTSNRRLALARRSLDVARLGLTTFVILILILQGLPPHYDMVRQGVSDLAVGPFGALMGVGFFISGVSILAFVVGTIFAIPPRERPVIGLALLTSWGMASLALGFFPTDIVDASGYPGARSALAMTTTTHGHLHLIIALIAFPSMVLGLVASSVKLVRGRLGRPTRWTLVALAALVVVLFFLLDPIGTFGPFGLLERSVSTTGFAWVILAATGLRRQTDQQWQN